MTKTLIRILAFVLVMTIAMVYVPAGGPDEVYAEEDTIVLNINENGILSWEAVPTAEMYQLYIDGVMKELIFDTTEFELQKYMTEKGAAEGTHPIRLVAFDESHEIAQGSIEYGFKPIPPEEPEEGPVKNLKIENGVLSWDPVPGAIMYRIYAGEDMSNFIYAGTEVDLDRFMNANNYQKGKYDIRVVAFEIGNEIGEGSIEYEFTPDPSFEPVAGEIQNVTIDENGILSWDPVPGVERYIVGIDRVIGEPATETAVNIDELIVKNVGTGYLNDKDTYMISIQTDSVSKNYYWIGVYDYYANHHASDEIYRYYGKTRYETSLKVADAFKEKLGVEKFDSVILAYGQNYADALAGSYLSAAADAPILLVDSAQSHIDAVQEYIKANLKDGGTIYMLGGTAVVPEKTVAGLSGYRTERLGGADRYETNIEILKKGIEISGPMETINVCNGTGFADSLSAAASGNAILLVRGNKLNDMQKEFMDSFYKENFALIYIVGGTGVVSRDIEKEVSNYTGGLSYRFAGGDRYETSQRYAYANFPSSRTAVIAFGGSFPDGLCGGSLAYAMDAPLILAANGKTDKAALYVKNFRHINSGAVLGGPALISDDSARAIFDVATDLIIQVK